MITSLPDRLHVYACKNGHKVYRKTAGNMSGCSRCVSAMKLVTVVHRHEGESDQHLEYRALTVKRAEKEFA